MIQTIGVHAIRSIGRLRLSKLPSVSGSESSIALVRLQLRAVGNLRLSWSIAVRRLCGRRRGI